jgi:SSS family solute:Na+ symporter/sodium/proline symporter
MVVKIIIMAVYICILVAVGIISRKQVNSVDDFLLGGRKMGPWVSAMAYGTTYFSAVIFIGYAGGIGWEMGTSALWIGVGNALFGSYLAWKVLARRTREITIKLNASTMPEFFQKRYDSQGMKIFSALVTFIFLVPYTSSVYKGLGYMFAKMFDFEITQNQAYVICVLVMGVITLAYLVLGGYIASAWNDLIQGIIMLVGIVAIVISVVASKEVGGLANGIQALKDIQPELGTLIGPNPIKLISLILLTSFGVWGLPQMVHKFYAIKSSESIKAGTIIASVFAVVIGVGAYFTGSWGRLFFDQIPNGSTDTIVPEMLTSTLSDPLLGIFMVLIFSASMSTLSSLVLVSSSAISVDLVKGYIKKDITDKKQMLLMRICCIIFVIISVVIALTNNATIITLMNLSWGTLAGCFMGPYLLGIYSKRTNKAAAWIGMLAGFVTMMTLILINGISYSTVGGCISMAVSVAVTFIATLFVKKDVQQSVR